MSGAEADVRSATVAFMQDWHRRYAGAANAVLVVAGHFDPVEAERAVRRFFAPVRPGIRMPAAVDWLPEPTARRDVVEKAIPRAIVYLTWPVAAWGSPDGDGLELFSRILERRLARAAAADAVLDSAFTQVDLREVAGMVTIGGLVARGGLPDSAEAVLRHTLDRLLAEGPSGGEVAASRAQMWREFLQSIENLAFRGSRTDILGLGALFHGNAEHFSTQWSRIEKADAQQLQRVGTRWLAPRGYALHVVPSATRTAQGSIDRRATVEMGHRPVTKEPILREFRIESGIAVVAVDWPRLPLTDLTIAFRAGTGTDGPAETGRAAMALRAVPLLPLSAGRETLADGIWSLGGTLNTSINRDFGSISVSLPSSEVLRGLGMIATALANVPSESALRVVQDNFEHEAGARRNSPMNIRERVLGCLVDGHANCHRAPSAADRTPISATLDFFTRHYQPGNATLLVSGDLGTSVTEAAVAAALAPWRGGATPLPQPVLSSRPAPAVGAVLAVDHPAATQAHVVVAEVLPEGTARDPLLETVLVYALRQRLMANLREAKGWIYEVYPYGIEVGSGRAVMRFNVPVQNERLADAMDEIVAEMVRLQDEPISLEFLASVRTLLESQELGSATSLRRMNDQILEGIRTGQGKGYLAEARARLQLLTPADVQSAARSLLHPNRLQWVIAAPREVVRKELSERGVPYLEVETGVHLR